MCQFVSFGLTIKHKMAKVLTVSCSSHLLIETLGFGRRFKTKKQKITVVFTGDMKNYQS